MWALGFIVHELLTGRAPFLETPVEAMSSGWPTVETGESEVDIRLLLQFCDGNAGLPLELLQAVDASESEVLFIRSLLVSDPRARATVVQALLDPWITGEPAPEPATKPQALRDRALANRVPASPYIPLEAPSWAKSEGGQLATFHREEDNELVKYLVVPPEDEMIRFYSTYGRYSEAKIGWFESECGNEADSID